MFTLRTFIQIFAKDMAENKAHQFGPVPRTLRRIEREKEIHEDALFSPTHFWF